jgi:hypothetical protein
MAMISLPGLSLIDSRVCFSLRLRPRVARPSQGEEGNSRETTDRAA